MPAARRPPRAERRASLLRHAERTFAQGGWDGTSIDQIAAAAGVSAPVLYDHFASKQALFLELVDVHLARLMQSIEGRVVAAEGVDGKLRASIEGFFSFVEDDRFAWRCFFRDTATHPEIAQRQRAAQEHATREIARMFGEGGGPDDDLLLILAAQLFKSALNGLAAWWWDHPDLERPLLIEVAYRALAHGLVGADSPAPG